MNVRKRKGHASREGQLFIRGLRRGVWGSSGYFSRSSSPRYALPPSPRYTLPRATGDLFCDLPFPRLALSHAVCIIGVSLPPWAAVDDSGLLHDGLRMLRGKCFCPPRWPLSIELCAVCGVPGLLGGL